ncbi:MAG TPA: hypothetical protein VF223_23250 [Trebonia sp.]
MGMRSAEGAQGTTPPMLRVAAAAQAVEAVGLCVAIAANVIDSASGNDLTASNAIGFIVVEAIVAIGVAWIASGLARVRPWSRTPAVMTQVLTAVIGVWLLQAGRFEWGVPALLLAIAGLAGLFTPSSLRALTRR